MDLKNDLSEDLRDDLMEKVTKQLLGEQIEKAILEYIRENSLKEGDKLPSEAEFCEIFGVSRSTVREAVRSLVIKGVLAVRRGSGTFILSMQKMPDDPLGISQMDDKYKLALELLEVRLMIEPEIAFNAALHRSPEQVEKLSSLCDEVEEIYMKGENHTLKDVEFHTCIAACSGNRVVQNLVPIINTAVITFVNLTNRKLREETIATHRAVLNAIRDGDAQGAKCAMIMHLTYNRQELQKQLEFHKNSN